MEHALERFIHDQRALGHVVTGGMIRAEAVRLLSGTNFSASNGWLNRFLHRKRFSFRRVTTSGRDLPANAAATVKTFLSECGAAYQQPGFDRDSLLNGDETSIYLDPPTRATFAPTGPAFDVHHGDEWEEEGALTDSDNDDDEEEREE